MGLLKGSAAYGPVYTEHKIMKCCGTPRVSLTSVNAASLYRVTQ